jgi:hypothetical protein
MLSVRRIAALSVFLLVAVCGFAARAQEDDGDAGFVPLRLSYIEGSVSFWREGAEDWVEARLNTPLAAGDALYTGSNASLELQMGSHAFIRLGARTEIVLINQEADYVQLKLASGRISLDFRALPSGSAVELNTPNAAFTIDHPGYYRVDVDGDTRFITRRGGRATLIPPSGEAMGIRPSEEVVVEGFDMATAETHVAPEPDQWDLWNYERTDNLINTASERYLAPGTAGAYELDHYGSWREVPEYGPVWVPGAVAPGWTPYGSGSWVWDPYYEWTWIDDAPWGWAPFHYGRWVHIDNYWAWAPGPVVVRRPVYSPALVAFFHTGPSIGWVPLSWGEPVIPWWGRSRLVGKPWWGGWGGKRLEKHTAYRNVHAICTTPAEHFGRRHVRGDHRWRPQAGDLVPVRGALPIKPVPASLMSDAPKGERPPYKVRSRPVVATRAPREFSLPWRSEASSPGAAATPAARIVAPPKRSWAELPRPGLGNRTGQERRSPPLTPRLEERRHQELSAPAGATQQRRDAVRLESGSSRAVTPQRVVPPRPVRESPSRFEERRRHQESFAPAGATRERRDSGRLESGSSRAAPPRAAMPSATVRESPATAGRESSPATGPRDFRKGNAASTLQRQPAQESQRGWTQREQPELPGTPANRMFRSHSDSDRDRRR